MSAPNFRLLETMRWAGGVALLDRHLARLAASAAFFGFAYDEAAVFDALAEAVGRAGQRPPPRSVRRDDRGEPDARSVASSLRRSPSAEGDPAAAGRVPGARGGSERERGERRASLLRLRLLLSADGTAEVEATPLDPDDQVRRAVVHPEPVEAGGPFWRHKTTHRSHYEAPYQQARAAGFDEAILLDRDGQVVEGTRTTVWIERGGRLLTPPLAVGGLPGVMRVHLLDTRPDAAEAPLTRADLRSADVVYVSNAVRGLQRVSVYAPPVPL